MKAGFVNVFGITVYPMGLFAAVVIALVLCFFYAGQKNDEKFNIWDAFMADGKTSVVAILFFGTWATTTWVILDREMNDKLDSAFFEAYVAAWVAPLIVRLGGHAWAAANNRSTP